MSLKFTNDYDNYLSVLKSWWILIGMRGVTEIKINVNFTIAQDTADNAFSKRLLDREHWLFLLYISWLTSLLLFEYLLEIHSTRLQIDNKLN